MKSTNKESSRLPAFEIYNAHCFNTLSVPRWPNPTERLTNVSGADSLVVFSPTRDGRVWDIQFEIIAMVLSTAPSFSSGALIAVELMSFHSD